MGIKANLENIKKVLSPFPCKLIAVSKTYPAEAVMQAIEAGQIDFGENKVQEMVAKWEVLPKNINWHLIGHLQTNKVKYIAPFVYMIHSVDSYKLLKEVNKEAVKNNRIIPCLLQIHIAEEETKFGFSKDELLQMLNSEDFRQLHNIKISGLMGMATNTEDQEKVRMEFRSLKNLAEMIKKDFNFIPNIEIKELSMGMSGDYMTACEEGSTMVRIGSAIFGHRDYSK